MKLTASLLALILAAATVSACSPGAGSAPAVGAAGQPSSSDVNPITGTRGGSGSSSNH